MIMTVAQPFVLTRPQPSGSLRPATTPVAFGSLVRRLLAPVRLATARPLLYPLTLGGAMLTAVSLGVGWLPTSAAAAAVITVVAAARLAGRRWTNQPRMISHAPRLVVREPERGWPDLEPDDRPTAMTVAVVGESPTPLGAAAQVARLAELAVNDELLVVYGLDDLRPSAGAHAVVAGLRDLLPRYDVVALHVLPHACASLGRDAALVNELLELGSLPIVITSAAAAPNVAAELSGYLQADRVVRVSG